MSRSKTASGEKSSDEAQRAHEQLSQMMRQGRSFSGRERNCCFLNTGENQFATASALTGFDYPDDGRALATIDWDGDGDLDVWTTNRNAPRIRYLQNNHNDGNWLSFDLKGNGTTSNADAIGARVSVKISQGEDSQTLIRTLRAGEGFLTQSSDRVHFGLGNASMIESVTVEWPGGSKQSLMEVVPNRHYQIVQEQTPQSVSLPFAQLVATTGKVPRQTTSNTATIPFVRQLPTPELAVESLDGQSMKLTASRKMVLVLWSITCRPCLDELNELKAKSSEFDAAGIQIVTVNTDGLDSSIDRSQLAERINKLELPFQNYFATDSLINNLQSVQIYLLANERTPSVPTSYLINNGRLSHMYRGRAPADRLLADSKAVESSHLDRLKTAAFLPGRMIDDRSVRQTQTLSYVWELMDVARQLEEQKVYKPAIAIYREAIELLPKSEMPHFKLGLALQNQGRKAEALDAFQAAYGLNPDFVPAMNNIAAIHLQNRNVAAALPLFRKITQLEPNFADAHYNLGLLLRAKNDMPGAYKELLRAHQLSPQNEKVCCDLAALLAMQGERTKAKELFGKALKIKPEDPQALLGLGNLAALSGDLSKAKQLMTQALRGAGNNAALANHIRSRLIKLNKSP